VFTDRLVKFRCTVKFEYIVALLEAKNSPNTVALLQEVKLFATSKLEPTVTFELKVVLLYTFKGPYMFVALHSVTLEKHIRFEDTTRFDKTLRSLLNVTTPATPNGPLMFTLLNVEDLTTEKFELTVTFDWNRAFA
jgi:hypothetical protein